MTAPRPPDRSENTFVVAVFAVMLAFHAWGASVGWNNQNLPGCEFRQTQTAISALFILREDNYSLAYPTPVLGKPWSIPMEFPLYQWSVAKLTQVTGWTLTQSGRAVTLGCFYLTLPALYLLLRRLNLPWGRSLLVLACVVGCPLYIFYARSFLIETMAWMFGAWFLLGYVRGAGERRWPWLALAVLAGIGAGLVKVTTLIAFFFPAIGWTLVWFWRDWQSGTGRARAMVLRTVWCALAVVPAIAVASWWVRYSDAIKAKSPAGAFLQSGGMSGYNFGIGVRFDPDLWAQHWVVLFREIASPAVLLIALALAVAFGRRWWGLIAVLAACFLGVQLMFPILYAWHEYYYVAITMLPMIAIGLGLIGVLESRLPRALAWVAVATVLSLQAWVYLSYHYPWQNMRSDGGSQLTVALRKVTEPDDVLIIAGSDWSSMMPYYAQRRAFMIRRALETTWDVIFPAYDQLQDEPVAALILYGEQRENHALVDITTKRFGLDPRPAFTWQDTAVYLRADLRADDLALLADVPGLTLAEDAKDVKDARQGREIDLRRWKERHLAEFARFTPRPWKYFSTFGLNPTKNDGRDYLWAHPDTKLWFHPPAGSTHLAMDVVFLPEAFSETLSPWDRSDGVEIVLTGIGPDGSRRELARRHFNPRDNPADRGQVTVRLDFEPVSAGDLELAILPGPANNYSRDWFLLDRVRIE